MNRFLLFIPIFVTAIVLFSSVSQADVLLEDIQANNRFSSSELFSEGTISTGSGNVGGGDYVLFTCVTEDPNNAYSFLPPTPDGWTEVDTEKCGGSSGCISGIWGGFVDTPNAFDVTCSWGPGTSFVFAAGSFRYAGVDGEIPIIAYSCFSSTTETGDEVNFPQIVTEAGSQVVYILNRSNFTFPGGEPITSTGFDLLNGGGTFFADAFNTFTHVATQGETRFYEEGGLTDPFSITVSDGTTRYRACTIALRMGMAPPPDVAEVPTLNEWGLILFAAFAGIAGFWYIRRRQIAA